MYDDNDFSHDILSDDFDTQINEMVRAIFAEDRLCELFCKIDLTDDH